MKIAKKKARQKIDLDVEKKKREKNRMKKTAEKKCYISQYNKLDNLTSFLLPSFVVAL